MIDKRKGRRSWISKQLGGGKVRGRKRNIKTVTGVLIVRYQRTFESGEEGKHPKNKAVFHGIVYLWIASRETVSWDRKSDNLKDHRYFMGGRRGSWWSLNWRDNEIVSWDLASFRDNKFWIYYILFYHTNERHILSHYSEGRKGEKKRAAGTLLMLDPLWVLINSNFSHTLIPCTWDHGMRSGL